jgi:hypothetical protein
VRVRAVGSTRLGAPLNLGDRLAAAVGGADQAHAPARRRRPAPFVFSTPTVPTVGSLTVEGTTPEFALPVRRGVHRQAAIRGGEPEWRTIRGTATSSEC